MKPYGGGVGMKPEPFFCRCESHADFTKDKK